MKKLIASVLIISAITLAPHDRVIRVRAQSLPITKTLAWDANSPTEQVTNYTVSLDGAVIGNPTGTTQQITFTTVGIHVIALTATNLWGTSPATTLNVNVIVPSNPRNLNLK